MKILILMSYYNRPKLVRNALNSILKANEHHQDWALSFGDDGSVIPGAPIVEEILHEHMDKVNLVQTGMSLDDKLERGIRLGWYANEEIRNSDADVAMMLCDDDELHPQCLKRLSDYFTTRTYVKSCYSKLALYNPLFQKSGDVSNLVNKYNQWSEPINPVNKVDASQVAWRLECCKKYGAWFAASTKFVPGMPWAKDTDKSFFEQLYEKCGPSHPTNFIAQYKGIHDYQLMWAKKTNEDGLRAYDNEIRLNAGVKF